MHCHELPAAIFDGQSQVRFQNTMTDQAAAILVLLGEYKRSKRRVQEIYFFPLAKQLVLGDNVKRSESLNVALKP